MLLDATTKSVEIVLGAAATANNMPVTAVYVDITTTTTVPGSSDTASNGTTPVTIVAAPAASTQRKVNYLSIYNADTASKEVTVSLNNNATLRSMIVVTLQVGDSLIFTDTQGWYVQDTAGNKKSIASPPTALFASPPAIGGTTPAAGSFTTLSVSTPTTGTFWHEGTFTGTLTPGTSGTITMGNATGTWTKIGHTYFFEGLFDVSSVSSPVGSLILSTDLPEVSANNTRNTSAVALRVNNTAAAAGLVFQAYVANNTKDIVINYFAQSAGTEGSNMAAFCQATTSFVISGHFRTN